MTYRTLNIVFVFIYPWFALVLYGVTAEACFHMLPSDKTGFHGVNEPMHVYVLPLWFIEIYRVACALG